MISKALIELIFSAFSIERWNDHPRTAQFTEMDKQAHKAMIAYFIAKTEEDNGTAIDWDRLIAHGAFSFFHRVLVTDIKPPVFHRLMKNSSQQQKLNGWVGGQLRPLISPVNGRLWDRLEKYLLSDPNTIEDRILRAAHYIATRWEFKYIYHWSKPFYGIEETKKEIVAEIEKHGEFIMVRNILEAEKLTSEDLAALPSDAPGVRDSNLISLVGQLRFQKRWAQVYRVPDTSVLGHLLMVGLLSWLVAIDAGLSIRRRCNDFYAGLFHDLPEVLTRDIISPVKRSVEGMDEMIKQLEEEVMQKSLYPLLHEGWEKDIRYLVTDEFENRIRPGAKVSKIEGDFKPEESADENDPIDGKLIEICDKFAAYVEAQESIRIGVHPPQIVSASVRTYDRYMRKEAAGYPATLLFDCFK